MKVWVVGGDSGIGRAIAQKFEAEMHEVLATGQEVDVRQPHALREFITDSSSPDSPIDKVVFSAGINYLEWIGAADSYRQAEVINTNLIGFINLMEELVASYALEQPLDVLAISSDAAVRPLRTSIAYCASKAGLDQAVRVAARELGPKGWHINALSPGMTHGTRMQQYIDMRVPDVRGWDPDEALMYETSQEVVPGRIDLFQVADFAYEILSLAPNHLNGSIITLNGGR